MNLKYHLIFFHESYPALGLNLGVLSLLNFEIFDITVVYLKLRYYK